MVSVSFYQHTPPGPNQAVPRQTTEWQDYLQFSEGNFCFLAGRIPKNVTVQNANLQDDLGCCTNLADPALLCPTDEFVRAPGRLWSRKELLLQHFADRSDESTVAECQKYRRRGVSQFFLPHNSLWRERNLPISRCVSFQPY